MPPSPPPCTPAASLACHVGDGRGPHATRAVLDGGHLRVTLADGVELVRAAGWLAAQGDGRAPVEVLLRPGGTALAVTWRDGRRRRYDVSWLRAAEPAAAHPAGARRSSPRPRRQAQVS